jgi:hypothetical protein
MATRILIQLIDTDGPAANLPAGVNQLLQRAGAKNIRASHAELPGLFTAIVPEAIALDELLVQLKNSPGVRHAEADAFRGTL